MVLAEQRVKPRRQVEVAEAVVAVAGAQPVLEQLARMAPIRAEMTLRRQPVLAGAAGADKRPSRMVEL
jgi:hypothetical protein